MDRKKIELEVLDRQETSKVTADIRLKVRKRPLFTGLEDHTISLKDASDITQNFRKWAGKDAIKGGFFGIAAVRQLLAQEGIVGMRYYYGKEDDGRPVMILVGAKPDGNDLVEGFILERAIPCPPFCGWPNPLNGQAWDDYVGAPDAPKVLPPKNTKPVFTGLEQHLISLEESSKLARNYRESVDKDAPKGGYFAIAPLRQLVSQEGIVGMRYYYAMENDGRRVLVLCGVDAYGNDLFEGFLMERAIPCPPFCGWPNPLNS